MNTQQSNQNAGADLRPCPWCQLWQAAYWASQIDYQAFPEHMHEDLRPIQSEGDGWLDYLALFETDCPGCQRSAEIHRGNVLGEQQAAWRAEMWEKNPVMRQFMRAGPGETFAETGQ